MADDENETAGGEGTADGENGTTGGEATSDGENGTAGGEATADGEGDADEGEAMSDVDEGTAVPNASSEVPPSPLESVTVEATTIPTTTTTTEPLPPVREYLLQTPEPSQYTPKRLIERRDSSFDPPWILSREMEHLCVWYFFCRFINTVKQQFPIFFYSATQVNILYGLVCIPPFGGYDEYQLIIECN